MSCSDLRPIQVGQRAIRSAVSLGLRQCWACCCQAQPAAMHRRQEPPAPRRDTPTHPRVTSWRLPTRARLGGRSPISSPGVLPFGLQPAGNDPTGHRAVLPARVRPEGDLPLGAEGARARAFLRPLASVHGPKSRLVTQMAFPHNLQRNSGSEALRKLSKQRCTIGSYVHFKSVSGYESDFVTDPDIPWGQCPQF